VTDWSRGPECNKGNELLSAMKANPGQVSIATAGVNSSGHLSIEAPRD